MEKKVVEFVVHGQCYSLKNSHMWARGRSIKHPKAAQFEKDFLLQVPRSAKVCMGSSDEHLRAIVQVWYPSWRQDVDVEITWDLLQKAGVVSNDRWIREKIILGRQIDPDDPRVYVRVEEI